MLLYVDAQYASPYAMSVFVGLKEKGIPFDMQTLDLSAGANRTPEYAATSLTQRVPTLVDGDESAAAAALIDVLADGVLPLQSIRQLGWPEHEMQHAAEARSRRLR